MNANSRGQYWYNLITLVDITIIVVMVQESIIVITVLFVIFPVRHYSALLRV